MPVVGQERNQDVNDELELSVEHEKAFVQLLAEAVVALLRAEAPDDTSHAARRTGDTACTANEREMDDLER